MFVADVVFADCSKFADRCNYMHLQCTVIACSSHRIEKYAK